jgi:hypothetical protein
MRAYFSNGVDKMHIPWAVEGLPTLLHLSLFLFFSGVVIFLFNVDQEVFICVVWWIGLFSVGYGLITLLPLIRHDSPYNTPLSIPTWFLFANIKYMIFNILIYTLLYCLWCCVTILVSIFFLICGAPEMPPRFREFLEDSERPHVRDWRDSDSDSRDYERWDRDKESSWMDGWVLGGVKKKAEEMASKQSSEIDVRILDWTISALGDDDSGEVFRDDAWLLRLQVGQ